MGGRAFADTGSCTPRAPVTNSDVLAVGEGDDPARAKDEAVRAIARAIGWPSARALPPSVAIAARAVETCLPPKGRVRLTLALSKPDARAAFETLASRERETLASLAFLARSRAETVAFPGLLGLRSHLRSDDRTSLALLVATCRSLGGCASPDATEQEASAEALLAQGESALEFTYAPEDDTAGNLLGEIDATLRGRGLSVRGPSVTSVERQLRTRCQRVIFPRVEGENLRVVELACEADALVAGRKVASARLVGRGQDISADDATIEARRRLALEEFRFLGSWK